MYEIILASQSPRRRQLLEDAGFKIHVHPVKVSENIEENLNPAAFAQELSKRKALHFLDTVKDLKLQKKIILTADTVVAIDSDVLGKPQDFAQAEEFLERLSERMHSVTTSFTLVPEGLWSNQRTHSVETKVWFRTLSLGEIKDYISTGEPMDKAGAYGIQGLGGKFVEKYEGSWSNVVGLPMEDLQTKLMENHWDVARAKS